jgi:hypothetical protein
LTTAPRQARRLAAVALTAALVALLAALPTMPASASPPAPTPSLTLPVTVSGLPVGEVENLLAGISLGGLNTAQLTEALSKLPGLSTLPAGKLSEALTKAIESLTGKGATLGNLLSPGELVPTLETDLKKLLSPTELLSLLKGENLTTKLTEALGSLNPSQLLGTLLGSAANPEQLLTQLLKALNPETLKALLGTTLTGEPFSKTTVGGLASSLGTTTSALAEGLGTTLTSTAMALTAPLANGKLLGGVINGVKGLTLGLLGGAEGKETSKESGKESTTKETTGSSGPQGPGGSSGAAGSASVVVNNPLAQHPTAAGTGSRAVGKLKILSHRVRGRIVTLVVQVPAAGNLALGGSGVRSVRRETARAERVTLRTVLTRAGASALRKHHRLTVRLRASFKSNSGSSSSAAVTVTFA